MNDLDLLRYLGSDLDSTSPFPAERLGARVRAGLADGTTSRRRWPGSVRGARRWTPALAVGVAAVAAVVVTGLPKVTGQDPAVPGGAGTTLGARQILLAAASAARADIRPAPPANAFVYTRSHEIGYTHDGKRFEDDREVWLSVDGRQDGALTPSGDPQLVPVLGCPRPGAPDPAMAGRPCTLQPAYVTDVPTSPAAVLEYLRKAAPDPENVDSGAYEHALGLLMERVMPAASRAALFEALAQLEGISVRPDVRTVTGRQGVAVANKDANGGYNEMIFDPASHEVIGVRQIAEGRAVYSSAVTQQAIVDQVRMRPDGSRRS